MPAALPLIGQVAVQFAAGVAISALANALRPPGTTNMPTTVITRHGFTFDLQVGESVPYSAVFGIGRASHALHYVNEYGEGNAYRLQIVHRIGIGEHDGLEQFLVDEKPVTLSGSNANARGYSIDEFDKDGDHHLWVKVYTGAPGQTADAELDARSNPSGRWTSASKMTGWAYLIITLRYHPDLFGSTLPTFGSVWRGLKLPDFRDEDAIFGDPSTYVFTKNNAVLKWNYRRGIYVNGVKVLGMGFPAYANDLAYYTNAANVCDELVEYPETDDEMPRYEFGREIADAEEHLSVLGEFDASMAGYSFKRGGADAPLPGQQLVSLGTLNDNDLLRGYSARIDLKGSVSQKKTAWHGQYVSAAAGYALVPFAERINTTLETTLGGRRSVTLDQPYERMEERAQARAEIDLRRQVFAGTRVETFTPKAFKYEVGDLVTRVCEWGSVAMVVEATEPLKDRTGVTLTLRQWSNTIVPASGEEFVTLPPDAGAVGDPAVRTIAVTGLDVDPYSRTVSGTTLPYGRAVWDQITDRNVDQVMIRYWPTAGSESADGESAFADAPLQSAKVFGPLSPDTPFTGYVIPIRKDARTCVPVGFAFTSGALVAGAISAGALDPVTVERFNWLTLSVKEHTKRFQETVLRVKDLSQVNQGAFDELRRSLAIQAGNDRGYFDEQISLAIAYTDAGVDAVALNLSLLGLEIHDPVTGLPATVTSLNATILTVSGQGSTLTAHGTKLDALEARLGSNTAMAKMFADVEVSPTGGFSRIGIGSYFSDGVTKGATVFYLEATAGGVGRGVFAGDQFYFEDNTGTPYAMFDAAGRYFEVANIKADSIEVNRLEIAIRGAVVEGSEWEHNASAIGTPAANRAAWSACAVRYKNAAGTTTTAAVSAGATGTWSSGTMYVYWVEGATSFSVTTAAATAQAKGNVIVATYKGGKQLVTFLGKLIIDGTGGVRANSVTVSGLAYAASQVDITSSTYSTPYPSAWVDIASVTLTPDNGKIRIIAGGTVFARGPATGQCEVALRRGSTVLISRTPLYFDDGFWEKSPFSFFFEDTGVGTSPLTYSLSARVPNAADGNGNYCTISKAAGLSVENIKTET
jgi:hypothetical protein